MNDPLRRGAPAPRTRGEGWSGGWTSSAVSVHDTVGDPAQVTDRGEFERALNRWLPCPGAVFGRHFTDRRDGTCNWCGAPVEVALVRASPTPVSVLSPGLGLHDRREMERQRLASEPEEAAPLD